MQFISCISCCRTVSSFDIHRWYRTSKAPHLCLWFDETFCDLLLNIGTLKLYLGLKFAERIGKNALCNGVPSPHPEMCPSQSFVNIWQSGGQFLQDLCLWLRTLFKSKRLSLCRWAENWFSPAAEKHTAGMAMNFLILGVKIAFFSLEYQVLTQVGGIQ